MRRAGVSPDSSARLAAASAAGKSSAASSVRANCSEARGSRGAEAQRRVAQRVLDTGEGGGGEQERAKGHGHKHPEREQGRRHGTPVHQFTRARRKRAFK